MIFITVDGNNVVSFIHYAPLDSIIGLGKTEEELKKEGYFVNTIPKPNATLGKDSVLKFNKETLELYFEYVDRPLTMQEQINNLGQQLAQEKLSNIQKDTVISGLGQQVSDLKLQVIKLQGGTK